jgi:hypothetical protein
MHGITSFVFLTSGVVPAAWLFQGFLFGEDLDCSLVTAYHPPLTSTSYKHELASIRVVRA